jgi:hypothetical protein
VDEGAFRSAARSANPQRCVFEKALLAGSAACGVSARLALAEREGLACTSPVARTNCGTLLALLRERCAFALKLAPDAPLPHALAMKLQCGGIAGLRGVVDSTDADVHRLVAAARERHGSLALLPWPRIVATVRAWEGRRRHAGPRP